MEKKTLSLLDREPPLLDKDSDIWYSPRPERGDLAEARLFAFLRGSIRYGACQYRSSHGLRHWSFITRSGLISNFDSF
jgi:hypothetical protein